MWVIRSEEGPSTPWSFRLIPGNAKTVGRAAGADFILDAALVSRLHCRLTAGAAEIEVEDLDSTNGTYVNGARVTRALMRNGDRLKIGHVEFVVEHNRS
jgi:pSer/pThr/pTyr-binding forkhead associated (FHA) protein